ncbi:hypothetical protein EPA93_35750 [Ktedonosporobacter rubrisoli]|uniref:Uncharacterized protein n=1 Tax=Ktedonosporobacter rubrisoli TaxID=2509675 RepID=A0A4P6JZ61_KTERU|nr:hypothetical protein [Ktedonosporobacter rubrisoli]QBD81039.1 hypothetical protein EPA93_35750 [Ktedonosporobacter rubrisoli]
MESGIVKGYEALNLGLGAGPQLPFLPSLVPLAGGEKTSTQSYLRDSRDIPEEKIWLDMRFIETYLNTLTIDCDITTAYPYYLQLHLILVGKY